MKRLLKILICTIGVAIALFIIAVAVLTIRELLAPSSSEKINAMVISDLSLTGAVSIEDLRQKIVPFSSERIAKKYPGLADRKSISWNVLQPDEYKAQVGRIISGSSLAAERSAKTSVNLDLQGAITFCPPTIFMKYVGSEKPAAEYLIHVIHESFHALSCQRNIASVLPLVWEEGLTDYFAINVLENYAGMSADSFMAFPDQIALIRRLAEFIPETQLLKIYLDKDEAALRSLADASYGKGTYDQLTKDMNIVFISTSYSDRTKVNKEVESALSRINETLGVGEENYDE